MKLKDISFMRIEDRWRGNDLPNLADMLRYDMAFQSQADLHLIAFPTFQTKNGSLGGRVTHARWYSFGVMVKYLPREAETSLNIHSIDKTQWVTYRHARDKNGSHDYSKLVPFTLDAYCQAKDTDSL